MRPPNGIPEILSVALVAFLQYKRGSVLLSIGGGTLFYIFWPTWYLYRHFKRAPNRTAALFLDAVILGLNSVSSNNWP